MADNTLPVAFSTSANFQKNILEKVMIITPSSLCLNFVAPSTDEETRVAVMKRIETALAQGNGVVDNVDNWGKRKLAYEINGLTDGDYTLIDFHANPENIAELDRVLRITDAVERHMIVHRFDRDYC